MRTDQQRVERIQRGQAVVEFALVLPVLLLLLAGAVDLGNGFQTYIALTNAAREGAHFGINNGTGICTRVQQVLPGLQAAPGPPTCSAYYAVNADGSCNTSGTTRRVGGPVCVSVSYPLPTLMGAVIGFSTIPINVSATLIVFAT